MAQKTKPKTTNLKISQSMMKDWVDYSDEKLCGLVLKARLEGLRFPSTPAQRLGIWFEYKCTGALNPYDPTIPEPDVTKANKMTAPYIRMEKQVENYNEAVKHYKLTDLEAGVDLTYEGFSGTADIVAKVDGRISIIDLKTTGLFSDKWSEFGWDTESITNEFKPKERILTQAIHYLWITQKKYKTKEVDFYFWIFSTTNAHDFKIIKVNFSDEVFETHEKNLHLTKDLLTNAYPNLSAYPDLKRCSVCPLVSGCKDAIRYPKVEEIYFGGI